MRIAFSGTANTGKSTIIKYIIDSGALFATPKKTYRDVLKDNQHSSKTTTETQAAILELMIENITPFDNSGYNILHDRCPLDNVVYTLRAAEENNDFDEEFMATTFRLCKESMKYLDIIFWCKFDENINVEDDGTRDASKEYIKSIDSIFEYIYDAYQKNETDNLPFLDASDMPAIIKLEGDLHQKLETVKLYIDLENGDAIEPHTEGIEGLIQDMTQDIELDKFKKKLIPNEQLKKRSSKKNRK